MSRQFFAFLVLLQLSFWRDRSAVLFTFLFPAFLMLALGSLFEARPGAFASIEIRDRDGGHVARALRAGVEGTGWVARSGEVADAVLVIPVRTSELCRAGESVRLEVSYATADPNKALAIHSLLGSLVLQVNATLDSALLPLQIADPPTEFAMALEDSSAGYTDFLLFGLVGLNVLSAALFGVGVGSSWFREHGVLRRLWLTPAEPRSYLGAQLLHIALLLMASTGLLVIVGHLFFETAWPPLGSFLLVMACGSFALIPVGLAIAARTSNPRTTQMCANLVYFPLMLLSGVYFRPESMAREISVLMAWLPLKPFLDALRAVSGGTSPLELWSELGTLTLYGCTGAALARGVFRWNR